MEAVKKRSKKRKEKRAKVHQDLQGFDVKVNRFGELTSSVDVDRLNAFLNKNVEDKKLLDRN